MSKVLEKTLSGLVSSVFGTSSTSTSNSSLGQSLGGTSGLKNVSLGLVHFVEKLQAAQRISKQEEEYCLERESREWIKLLSSPGVSSAVVADIMCRALIASVRGFPVPSLHIHAIKLTQSPNVYQKKIGYLFVSQSIDPGSELTLLLVNTIQRDLTSANALEVAAALSSLPTVVTPDLTPVIAAPLTRCLAHQQVYVRRRAASMVGVIVGRGEDKNEGPHTTTAGGDQQQHQQQVPHLLHLLTDQDPGVALAAVCTLAKIYKASKVIDNEVRDQVARSAANLLTQALSGALPRDYHIKALPAPFPQIQMLRVLRELSTSDWNVPHEVSNALNEVLNQPWGGKEMSLYAVLLECIVTATALPIAHTLMPYILRVVLGFLKSSTVDLKYVGVKALAGVFSVVGEALTPTHLEAVMDCLYHSSSTLQSSTLRLLCAMANAHNYQAVCTTLQEFSSRSNDMDTQYNILGEMSRIVTSHCRDVGWGVDYISPLVLAGPIHDQRLTKALMHILEQGLQEEATYRASLEASQELLLKLFGHTSQQEPHTNLITAVLNLQYARDPKQVSKYFTDSLLEKLKTTNMQECDQSVFQCLKNIGLNDVSVCSEILALLEPYTIQGSTDLVVWQNATEIFRWLANPELSQRVIGRQKAIMAHQVPLDLTLSFLDEFVLKSLESGAKPYKPLGVSVRTGDGRSGGELGDSRTSTTESDDGHSSTPSTGITSTATSINSSVLNRSMIMTSRRMWSSKGRSRQRSEGEDSINRPQFDSGCETDGLHKTLLRDDDEDTDEVTEGSVEMADEAQEEAKTTTTTTTDPLADQQRSQLTQALLAGLGMARK